jgi:hypothetical protein
MHPETSTELHSTIQNSHFHHTSEKWANSTPRESENEVSITFPSDGITLKIFVEGELGCYYCIEARFDLGW